MFHKSKLFHFHILVMVAILFANCNFIGTSVPNVTITGKDVKKEIKKTRESTAGLSIISLLGSVSSSSLSSTATATAKTCPGYTTDSVSPSFTLPASSSYTNVNLTGSITVSTPQTWTSDSITTATNISAVLVNSSATCRYSTVSTASVSSGTIITGGSSVGTTISVSTVPAVLSIVCYTSSTSSVDYTLSLNPRPSSTTTTSSSFSSLFSIEGLIPDQLFASVAKIDDKEVYTYDSFLSCKKNYENIVFLYLAGSSQQLTYLSQCGGYVAPPAQVYVQGLACNLEKAGLIEF